jgi:hypothetical protein
VKPRDSSDEEHDLAGQARGDSSGWAVAPVLPTAAAPRSVSGVVAAPVPPLQGHDEPDDDATAVGHSVLPPLPEEQQAALSRRIRAALGQTLPLGTPVPSAVANNGAVRAYARTMLLGGRQVPGLPSAAPARSRLAERVDAATGSESVTPYAPTSVPPAAPLRGSEPSVAPTSDAAALRASFVRTVGLPTAPPPRRSRRPDAPESDLAPLSEPAPSSDHHEAFALDRPLTLTGLPALGRPPAEPSAFSAGVPAAPPGRSESTSRGVLTSVMLPPPPQAADYEPASSPSSLPPAPGVDLPPGAAATAPAAVRAAAPALLTDLPSANPFEGFEAPRETFVQRFLIVFVVALAVVGLFALAAMAFGLLGKTGW